EIDEDEEMKDVDDKTNGVEAESSEEEEETSKKSKKKAQHGEDVERLAEKAGLSVKRYLRKLERGEILFDKEGNPTAVRKKNLKKAKKEAKKAAKAAEKGEAPKKRKREGDDEEAVVKSEKKKKKKSKE